MTGVLCVFVIVAIPFGEGVGFLLPGILMASGGLGGIGSTVVSVHGVSWSSSQGRGKVGWNDVRQIRPAGQWHAGSVSITTEVPYAGVKIQQVPVGGGSSGTAARRRLAARSEVLNDAWLAAWGRAFWPDHETPLPPVRSLQFRATGRQCLGRAVSGVMFTAVLGTAAVGCR